MAKILYSLVISDSNENVRTLLKNLNSLLVMLLLVTRFFKHCIRVTAFREKTQFKLSLLTKRALALSNSSNFHELCVLNLTS